MASSSASKSTPCDSQTSIEAENDSQVFKRKSDDIGWNYGVLADPYNRDRVKCVLCSKFMSGGIHRLKEHIGQISGNVVSCKKATKEDQAKCRNAINESKAKKMKTKEVQEELLSSVNIKGLNVGSSQQREKAKESHSPGPMDRFATTINPEASLNVAKMMREQNINDVIWKERSNLVKDYFIDWAYDAGISFNALELDSFRLFSEALGQFGPRWKPPSSYEMREPLLKKAVERTKLKRKWRKEKDVLLANEASKAQEWIIPGLEDEGDEDVNGLEVEDDTSRVRELEEEDFESEEEEQVNENDIDFESDEERVLENYGEEEEDPLVLGYIS
ncbi:hAT transposon superfamily protein [Striga hermonthica]|uniref:HAT transposon superfamily protein n=1 Tax=Striga hermonthica TaxID=68872 RepID=A0A9N7NPB3_STRHE|nr:hAT transposon superfamily protein [Striga hermonthica]